MTKVLDEHRWLVGLLLKFSDEPGFAGLNLAECIEKLREQRDAEQARADAAERELAVCRGTNPFAANPAEWGHAAMIQGLTQQRDAAESRVQQLREALESIATVEHRCCVLADNTCALLARAALTPSQDSTSLATPDPGALIARCRLVSQSLLETRIPADLERQCGPVAVSALLAEVADVLHSLCQTKLVSRVS